MGIPKVKSATSRQAPPAEAVSPAEFRAAMRRLAGACCIVTTWAEDVPVGLTATAVCSVTAEPARLLVCINRSTYAHRWIARSGKVGINILDAADEVLALRFSGQDNCDPSRRFSDGDWSLLAPQAPHLTNALAWFGCEIADVIPQQTHDIFICNVTATDCRGEQGRPLIYFDGIFI